MKPKIGVNVLRAGVTGVPIFSSESQSLGLVLCLCSAMNG